VCDVIVTSSKCEPHGHRPSVEAALKKVSGVTTLDFKSVKGSVVVTADASVKPGTLADAVSAACKGGTIVLTGLSRLDATGLVPMFPFVMQEKRLIGSVYGSGRPVDDIVRLVEWYLEGRLKLQELVNRTYSLGQINQALDALAGAEGARGVVLQ